MKKRLFNILCIALFVLSLAGCKKEENNPAQKYLLGYISVDFPRFMHPGDAQTLNTKDIATVKTQAGDENVPIAYFVKNSATGKTDTLITLKGEVRMSKYEFVAPEGIGRYKLTFTASADGYSPSYLECEYDIVIPGWNEGASLTNYEIEENQEIFQDERDQKTYLVTLVGDIYWMRTNLQWADMGKACYEDDAAGDVFGRYYTHSEAMVACPEGWRLPSEEDWANLACSYINGAEPFCDIQGCAGLLMEDIYFNGTKMWEFWPSVDIRNTAHFSAIPTGRAAVAGEEYSFYDFGSYAMFWTAEKNGDSAGVRYINVKNPDLYYVEINAEYNALPVRCVREVDAD